MAQRIVLSREQVEKLRQLRGEVDQTKDGEIQNRHAELKIQVLAHSTAEEARPHQELTLGATNVRAKRIRRPWGFER
jgi:hypothetical protein